MLYIQGNDKLIEYVIETNVDNMEMKLRFPFY